MDDLALKILILGGPDGLTRAVARRLASPPGVADPDVIVHLGPALGEKGWPPSPAQVTASLGRAIAAAPRARVVAVSSAAIFPPRHTHPGMVSESRPAVRGVNALADAWGAYEAAVATVASSTPALTVLRPAPTPTADGDDYFSRLLRGPLASTFLGHDPTIQLLALDDLAEAVACAVRAGRAGVCHVAPSSNVPLHRALSLAGTMRVPLPAWILRWARPDALRILYSWTISGEKIEKDLGFVPRASSAEVAASLGGRALPEGQMRTFDPFGLDKGYIAWLHRTVIGFLHNLWWRVETAGLEKVPREGAAVLVGMHRGFMPFDGTMMLYDLVRHRARYPRFLVHPSLTKEMLLADFIRRQGGLMACRDNADFVLKQGELLGYFPEGIEGAFSYYREAYRLRRDFGRDEFVKSALRNRVPIIPFVTVGSAEIFPVLAKIDWGLWKRYTNWPCFPIAPPFPLLPFPLPSKWHTQVLDPLPVHEQYGPESAEDEEVVARIGTVVRSVMQAATDEMLARRKWIFFGALARPQAATPRSSEA